MIRRLLVVALIAGGCSLAGVAWPVEAEGAPKAVDTWAFCGVHPNDPFAREAARSMAQFSGIDATFGPCKDGAPGPSPPRYSPAYPGDRYVSPESYMQLVEINASVGMQTVVYDARVWDEDPTVRAEAKAFWRPVYEDIVAWDMGDEFDPNGPEWEILAERTQIVLDDVTAETYIPPYTNHLFFAVEDALTDIPGSRQFLSFDQYGGDQGVALAKSLDARVDVLMCALNTYTHQIYFPNPASIRNDSDRLVTAGCDMILVFGGAQVYGSSMFGPISIIDEQGQPTLFSAPTQEATGSSSYQAVAPARLLETRTGLSTIDGQSNGIGQRVAGTITEIQVGGRAGTRSDASSAVVTLTAIDAREPGFLTVYPCGTQRPTVAQLNYAAGRTVATTAILKLSTAGKICVYNSSATDVVVDVGGYFPTNATTFVAGQPARLMETRREPGLTTVDGSFLGIGIRGAGSVSQLTVTGRAGVPFGATSASLSVTVTNAAADGFVTVYPCEQSPPTTASVNFSAGASVTTNAVVTGIAVNGWVCLFTSTNVDMIVDVNGYSPSGASLVPLAPVRVLDSRTEPRPVPPSSSVFAPVRELRVTGVAGVPIDAAAVVVNLTVTSATKPGFVTVYPCGSERPTASNVNFAAGQVVSNLVVAEVGLHGSICLYSPSDPDYVVDVTAFHP